MAKQFHVRVTFPLMRSGVHHFNAVGTGGNYRTAINDALRQVSILPAVRGKKITRVVIEADVIKDRGEPESEVSKHADAGYMNDMRFGTDED